MIKFIARQKLRFDLGQSFLAIVNLSFLVIAAGDKIAASLGLSPRVVVVLLIPSVLLGVWLMGWILDRCKFMHAYQDEYNLRNDLIVKAIKEK